MGIGITPLNIGEIPYMAALKLVSAYQSKEKYENDMNIILAGGDPNKVKPKYWIRDINNDTDD